MRILLFATCLISPVLASIHAPNALSAGFGKLPLSFEANVGQADRRVKFLSRSSSRNLFLTPTEAVITVSGKKRRAHIQFECGFCTPTRGQPLRAAIFNPAKATTSLEAIPSNGAPVLPDTDVSSAGMFILA